MRKLLPLLSIFCAVALAWPNNIFADENFDTSLVVTYQVSETGTTRVTHEFDITNKQPLFAVSQYGLKVSSTQIDNVEVTSNGKTLDPEVTTTNNITTIGVTFPDVIAGQGKTRGLTISYDSQDAAVVTGQVLEVSIPKLQNSETYASYQVKILTPIRFGSPSRVVPNSYATDISPEGVVTTLTDLHNQSITAIYGDTQLFDLTLRYHLTNPHNNTRITQVALPPDTTFQKMYYHAIDPEPEAMERDQDGNWIATYRLPSNTTSEVIVTAQAQLSLEPYPDIPNPTALNHTQADEFWEYEDPSVLTPAAQLFTPEQINQYVVDNLSYNYQRLETDISRLGAVRALEAPTQALCQEFTDAFVALSRASDIPARRVTGYAHTENSLLRPLSFVQDVLHAWPEYYDPNKGYWVPIDPTWQHTSGGINYFTTFDLNHVVFAINGASSRIPFPAGSYKEPGVQTKDVEVSFGFQQYTTQPNLEIAHQSQTVLGIQLPFATQVTVHNPTGSAQYHRVISIESTDPTISSTVTEHTFDYILPFQTAHTETVYAVNDSWFQLKQTELQLQYDDETTTIPIVSIPRLFISLIRPETIAAVGITSAAVTFATGSILVFKPQWQSLIRWQSKKPQKKT